MPIGSMVEKFREEFEAHIEMRRAEADRATPDVAPALLQGAA